MREEIHLELRPSTISESVAPKSVFRFLFRKLRIAAPSVIGRTVGPIQAP